MIDFDITANVIIHYKLKNLSDMINFYKK